MKIRKAELKDVNQLYSLMNSTKELNTTNIKNYFPKDYIKAEIKNPMINFIVAEDHKKVIGGLVAELWKKEKVSFWNIIVVNNKFRNKGIAKELYKNYIKTLKNNKINYISALVKRNNYKMQKIINKLKFRKQELCYVYDKLI